MIHAYLHNCKYRIIKNLSRFWAVILCPIIILMEYRQDPDFRTAGDLFLVLFRGDPPFPIGENLFQIPVPWIMLMLSVSLAAANIISEDLELTGYTHVLKIGKRSDWIMSRYLTGVTITLISYGIIILACLLFSVIYKIKADLFPSAEFAEINYPNINKFSPIFYFLPLAALLTNSIWQMTLEIMTDSIWAFFFVLVLNIISCYFAADYLPGNGAMLIRSRIGGENINKKLFLISRPAQIIILLWLGILYSSKMEFIGKRNEN